MIWKPVTFILLTLLALLLITSGATARRPDAPADVPTPVTPIPTAAATPTETPTGVSLYLPFIMR